MMCVHVYNCYIFVFVININICTQNHLSVRVENERFEFSSCCWPCMAGAVVLVSSTKHTCDQLSTGNGPLKISVCSFLYGDTNSLVVGFLFFLVLSSCATVEA